MPFSLFLAQKYLKPKRSVTSVITCVSVLGVLLGVAVVIIVRAVMTGFGDLWQEKILDFKPHVTLQSAGSRHVIHGEEELAKRIEAIPGVTSVSPAIDTPVMLEWRGRIATPMVMGVDSDRMSDAYKIGKPVSGSYDLDGDSIVLGIDLARSLGGWVGDDVTVYSPKTLASRDEIFLPLKWRVTGIFSSGQRDYDAHFAICSLPNARDLMGMEEGVFAVHVKTAEPANAPVFEAVCEKIAAAAPMCRVISWRQADREIFNALAVEKNMTALLLMLITVVALFCVMNTLLVLTRHRARTRRRVWRTDEPAEPRGETGALRSGGVPEGGLRTRRDTVPHSDGGCCLGGGDRVCVRAAGVARTGFSGSVEESSGGVEGLIWRCLRQRTWRSRTGFLDSGAYRCCRTCPSR